MPHNPPPARLQPRQFTPIHAEFMGQTRRNERRCRVRFRVFADDIGRARRAGYVGWRGNLARD
ncbi:hypothetical protein GBB45_07455 [Bifidobacterium longum]|nr:hypothetical protein GBK20_06270 [Bifidobacterium longum]KAB7386807.1 hypothetical protein GBB45_07455 [Bifidobacterium longum]